MGMFDSLYVEVLMPVGREYQTKDLACKLNTYVVSLSGRLLLKGGNSCGTLCDSDGDIVWSRDMDQHYNGDLYFCCFEDSPPSSRSKLMHFLAHFYAGDLQWIKQLRDED